MIEIGDSKKVLFSATWCQPCKFVIAQIRRKNIESEILVVKIDDDVAIAKSNYGIMAVPTLIYFDSEGKIEKKFVGQEVNAEIETYGKEASS